MQYFWKTIGLILIAVILWLVLQKQEKDYATVLSLAVCCMSGLAIAAFLQPMADFLSQLVKMGEIGEGLYEILFKAVGIGFVAELTGRVCTDAGNNAMAGMVRILGSSAILYVSIPLLETLMNLIQNILGVL